MDPIAKIQEDIRQILIVLERNTVVLNEHIRRTGAAEAAVAILQSAVGKLEDQNKALNVIWKVAIILGGLILGLNQLAGLLDKLR